MDITIFILCHDEDIMIPLTFKHYMDRFPKCKFIVLDNKSTDKSIEIINSYENAKIISWDSGGIINDKKYQELKNTKWKDSKGWVIVIDMDEWLDIDEKLLKEEEKKGTTIIKVKGIQIVGDSKKVDLSDLDLNKVNKGFFHKSYDKHVCFLNSDKGIKGINYSIGAHKSGPVGNVVWSKDTYYLKHMNTLGELWCIDKYKKRATRARAKYLTYPKTDVDAIKAYKYEYGHGCKKEHIFKT